MPGSRWDDVQPWASLALRLGLAVVALWAGLSKIGDLPGSIRAVRAYELLPEQLAVVVGSAMPVAEIILGVLLLVGLFTRASALAFSVLMVVFIAAIASAWSRGLAIDCGCFGGGGQIAPEDTRYLEEILRDLAFVAGGLLLAWRPRSAWSLDGILGLTAPAGTELDHELDHEADLEHADPLDADSLDDDLLDPSDRPGSSRADLAPTPKDRT